MAERIFSASASGRRGRAPSQIDLIEANMSPEEIARRRTEQRKRELIDAGRKGSKSRCRAISTGTRSRPGS